ncbi:hypothetical protein ACFSZS_28220 [Seohaeicola zhoushanensis]
MQNLTAQLIYHARVRPEAEALVYDDTRLSWRALHERVQEIAAGCARAASDRTASWRW